MKRVTSILVLLIMSFAAGRTVSAQTGGPPPGSNGSRTMVSSDTGVAPVIPSMFEPITTGGLLDDLLVKNKPLAAVFESETVSVQANGSQVVRRITIRAYRDSDGRTRREQIFRDGNAAASPNAPARSVTIYDPVALRGFSINPAAHTATSYKLSGNLPSGGSINQQIPQITKILRGDNSQSGAGSIYILAAPKIDPLGMQTIAGVRATGRRITLLVPAAALGNANPVDTTYEIWIAEDLKILVKCVISNPVSGTHTFLLTSLDRTEPARSLFEVPAGYPVSEMGISRPDLPPPIPQP